MIKLDHISLCYETEKALDHVSIAIDEQEAYTIIGRSGCGKSSLAGIMAKLTLPTAGSVSYQGTINENEFFKNTSLCLQGSNLFPWKTVYENILFVLKIRGIKEHREQKAEEALSAVGMNDYKDKYPIHLSGGQRQRAALACALASRANWMILDEPSTGLDYYAKEDFRLLILRIYKKYKIGYLLITHDIEEAVTLGRKIIVMEKANIKDVIDNPHFMEEDHKQDYHDFVKKLKECLF